MSGENTIAGIGYLGIPKINTQASPIHAPQYSGSSPTSGADIYHMFYQPSTPRRSQSRSPSLVVDHAGRNIKVRYSPAGSVVKSPSIKPQPIDFPAAPMEKLGLAPIESQNLPPQPFRGRSFVADDSQSKTPSTSTVVTSPSLRDRKVARARETGRKSFFKTFALMMLAPVVVIGVAAVVFYFALPAALVAAVAAVVGLGVWLAAPLITWTLLSLGAAGARSGLVEQRSLQDETTRVGNFSSEESKQHYHPYMKRSVDSTQQGD